MSLIPSEAYDLQPRLPVRFRGRLAAAAALTLVLALAGLVGRSAEDAPQPAQVPPDRSPPAGETSEDDPLGPNGACYVCHMTFVKEELAVVHLKEKISCATCHGLSAKHANDEDIGASKPDICYPRDKVDASCRECHAEHDVPARKVVAEFLRRKLSPQRTAVCTDCHGTHEIQRTAEAVAAGRGK